jgi:hypothetical protein
MTFSVERFVFLEQQLTGLIAALPFASKDEILFGDGSTSRSVGVAVRFQDTLGGRQLRISTVSMRGYGSGAYFQPAPADTPAARAPIVYAMKLAEHYCRPLPEALQKRFPLKNSTEPFWFVAPPDFLTRLPVEHSPLPGEVVVQL